MKTSSLFLGEVVLITFLLGHGQSFGATASDPTQTASGGGVTVTVVYSNLKSDDYPRFQVSLNTHSVALDSYDLKSITVLRDDSGKEYLPTAAENKGAGHHRQVTLTFPKISPNPKRVELVIKDVAGIKERNFGWNVE
jgi:hypothetical protein